MVDLITPNTSIFFDNTNGKHQYSNEAGNKYISVTTLRDRYKHLFEDEKYKIARQCEKAGRNPNHPKYLKYKGKTAAQLVKEWALAGKRGAERGNIRHNYLEDSIKSSNGFYEIFDSRYDTSQDFCKLYTIEDVLNNDSFGEVNLEFFINKGVNKKYPRIYNIIESFVNDGWKVYSEVVVFHNAILVSGLIDVLLVKGDTFVILDWKTNKDPVKFEGGYWEHDREGKRVKYIYTDKSYKEPLHLLPDCTGNDFKLQLGIYGYLAERFNIKLNAIILCHITHDLYSIGDKDLETNPDWLGLEKVDLHYIPYIESDIVNMLNDYTIKTTKGQYKVF